jgi:exodeoxyribonuclease V beta subunit
MAEELGERRRVAYVALTRAKNRCYLLSGAFNKIDESALGGVLDTPQALERLCKAAPDSVLVFEPQPAAGAVLAAEAASARLDVRTPARVPSMGYAETSFSALARSAEQDEPAPAKDHDQEVTPAPQRPVEAPGIRDTFPAGPRAGNCLHEMLEKVGGRGGFEEAIRRDLKRAGYDEKMAPQVEVWLQEVLATPLPAQAGANVPLAQVEAASQMREMEFQLATPGFSTAQLVQLVRRHGIPIPDLRAAELRGYLSGAIDLIYRHEGRWYVADYKSNRLDSGGQGYAPAAMEEAMAEHNYHLQYLIYTVALHRWLRSWLDGYDYDQHVGGVRYLFLRGMHPQWTDEQGGARGVFACRPPRALIEALDECFGLPAAQGRAA